MMLKKTLLAVGLGLATMWPALAVISVDSCIAEVTAEEITFQVSLHNVDDVPQQGPILIHLQAHSAPGQPWRDVNVWDVEFLRVGKGWNEEFTSSDEAALAKASNSYEARLLIEVPGKPESEKKFRMIQIK